MKKHWFFLVIAAMIVAAGCSKDEEKATEVSITANTVLPEGVTVSGMELSLVAGTFSKTYFIVDGQNTIKISEPESLEILGSEATATLTIDEPKLNGEECTLLGTEPINFMVKEANNVSWNFEVDTTKVILITNFVIPEIISYEYLQIIVLTEENEELVFYVAEGIDTTYLSGQQAFDFLGDYVRVKGRISNPNVNGNGCFPYCQNHENGHAFLTVQPVNYVEYIFVLPSK